MKAIVNRDDCIGCELCTQICPEVFQMDDEQIATVIANPVPASVEDKAKDAEDSCPTSAITIEE
ncbi:ferredoxin [Gudongella sp. DL1XJH-153]|uniref:ferredoxin n=1 Tax=Gudongella sp. DL1XJH-153 TaxID=3409804 RepID=UPI003BB63D0F